MMIVAPLLVAGIATSGYFGIKTYRASSQEATAKELVAKAMANGPSREGFEQVRKAVDAGEISREQAWAAGREMMEKAEKERMTAYFNTAAKDRDKYLDKLIDERLKMMKEWQARRAAEGPTTRPNREERGPTTRPEGERREGGPGGGARGDNQSPVDRAMNQEFRAALMRRMQERGIQMPGRGGWGGGRGPGGGGNRGGGGGR
jgi:hypothetical protein